MTDKEMKDLFIKSYNEGIDAAVKDLKEHKVMQWDEARKKLYDQGEIQELKIKSLAGISLALTIGRMGRMVDEKYNSNQNTNLQ